MTLAVLMIAVWQAVAVFVLCLVSKNRGYALLVGLAGAAVVSITGGNRYDGLDVLFVVVATLAAIWKLTPYEEGETRGKALAFAAKAAGVVLALIACVAAGLWYYANHGAVVEPAAVAMEPAKPAARLRSMDDETSEPAPALPVSLPAAPSPRGTPADLHQGMTEAEVIAVMGRPDNVASLVSSGGVRVEAWEYRGAHGVFHIYMKNGRKSL